MMHWIRTHKGDGCNLAMATDLLIERVSDVWQLQAYFAALMPDRDGHRVNCTVIAESGDHQEILDLRDEILNELVREQQRGNR